MMMIIASENIAPTEARTAMSDDSLILVVDDDSDLCGFLSFVIRSAGFLVSRARDGIEALEKATSLGPDIIVMDLCLPRLDGCSVMRRLKDDPLTKRIPILAITGHGSVDDAGARAWQAGCDLFLIKPVAPDKLLDALRTLLKSAAVRLSIVDN